MYSVHIHIPHLGADICETAPASLMGNLGLIVISPKCDCASEYAPPQRVSCTQLTLSPGPTLSCGRSTGEVSRLLVSALAISRGKIQETDSSRFGWGV